MTPSLILPVSMISTSCFISSKSARPASPAAPQTKSSRCWGEMPSRPPADPLLKDMTADRTLSGVTVGVGNWDQVDSENESTLEAEGALRAGPKGYRRCLELWCHTKITNLRRLLGRNHWLCFQFYGPKRVMHNLI